MYSVPPSTKSFSIVFVLLHLALYYVGLASALQVSVGAGQVSTTSTATSCDQLQEFSCVNDTCDQCAGKANGGTCRNGASCSPGQLCNSTPGHCLESTFCAPGTHTMPDAAVGTPKHFRCLSVSGLSPGGVVVIHQNHDLTGDACIANDTGVWATPNDELSNAVDTNPSSGNFPLCRRAGQSSASTEPIAVAGTTCFDPEDSGAISISADLQSKFPDINTTYWYSNNAADGSDDGTKRRLKKRGQDFRVPTGDVRATAAYTGILIIIRQLIDGLTVGNLEVVDQAHAETEQQFLAGGVNNQAWDADHFMELQLIPAFFQSFPQFQFIYDQMLNCPATYDVITVIVNSHQNLIGVASKVNGLKGKLFMTSSNGNPSNPTWALYYRAEVQALYNYLLAFRNSLFVPTVQRIAAIMDNIWNDAGAPGPSNGPTPGQAWQTFALGFFDNVGRIVSGVLAPNSGTQFRDDSTFGSTYQHDELK